MTIETKYNIGDEVWFITKYNPEKANAKVCAVNIYILTNGDVVIKYDITKGGYHWVRTEQELFPTKKELLKSL